MSLSVFQSIPLDGIVIVASPQELVSMVVEKAVKMAEMMEVPIVGLVENMSYVACPDCGKQIHLFGQGKGAFYDDAVVANVQAVNNGVDPDEVVNVCSAMVRPVLKDGDKPQSTMWGHMLVTFKNYE